MQYRLPIRAPLVVLCKVVSRQSGGLSGFRVNGLCCIFGAGFRDDPGRLAYLITDFQDECASHYVVFLNPGDDRAVCTFVAEYMAGDLILDFEVFILLSKKGRNFFVLFVMILACRS